MDSPKKQASKILRDKKMYQRWLAIFMCLALVVTSGTVTALKLTGQAWTGTEQVLTCTYQPHQHTPECYNEAGELVCGLSDKVLHTHDARCYDAEGNLVCGMEELEEHSHTSACYTEHRALICGQEEHEAIPEHHHTEDCYTVVTTEERVLTCGLEESDGEPAVEAVPGHVHTDACYAIETKSVLVSEESVAEDGTVIPAVYENQETKTLICGMAEGEGAVEGKPAVEGHHHTDACWTMQEVQHPELTCGLEESDVDVPEHHHTDECYAIEMVLTCDKPEVIAHEHTDACYDIQKDADGNEISRTLTCKLPQLVAHQHGDECFTEVALEAEGTYCGLEAHKHTGSCYMEVNGELVLTCGKEEHVHTDECFIEPVLYCGKEEHTHTEECYDADGNLICELEEHTHTAECYIEPEIEPVEVTETVANRFYNVELTAVYTGELAEEDELAIVAATTSQEEMETERDYAYSSQVPDSKVLPLGRTEFILTKNGEEVDRSEYAITATIIPSRESVAYLAMSQSNTDIMMLDEGGEPGGEQTIVVSSGFTAYELEDGKLAPVGYVEAKLDEIDLDTYMAEAYDEEGNPTYDETLAIHAHLSGSDFMLTAGVEEDVIQTLAAAGDQSKYRGDLKFWWDGYKKTGKNSYGHDEAQVESVYMHHTDSEGVKDQDRGPVKISEGVGHDNTYIGNSRIQNAPNGTVLSTVYPDAVAGFKDLSPTEKDQAERIIITHESEGLGDSTRTDTIDRGDLDWSAAMNASVGGNWKFPSFIGSTTKSISGIRYQKNGVDYATLEITPKPGYYVEHVMITCFFDPNYPGSSSGEGWNPYACGFLVEGSDIFDRSFTPTANTKVSIPVESRWFAHSADACGFYILIRTAPIPAPLFVKYDNGQMLDSNKNDITEENAAFAGTSWLQGGRTTESKRISNDGLTDQIYKGEGNNWDTTPGQSDLSYTAAGISPAAEKVARENGYQFAGWQLEYYVVAAQNKKSDQFGTWYYKTYDGTDVYLSQNKPEEYDSSNYLSIYSNSKYWFKVNDKITGSFDNVQLYGAYGSTFGDIGEYGHINLITNAKLTAVWEKLPQLEVSKTVANSANDTTGTGPRTFTFEIRKVENGTETPVDGFNFHVTSRTVNGDIRTEEVPQTGARFTITVAGDGTSQPVKITGLDPNGTYKVVEIPDSNVAPENRPTVTYKLDAEEPNSESHTFVASNTDKHEVNVTNDYAAQPKDQLVWIIKVDASDNTVDSWPTLAGAKFTLTSTDSSVEIPAEARIVETTGDDGIAFEGRLLEGTYTLKEDKAPAGYTGAADSITFKVDEHGVTVTGNADLTVAGAFAVHEDPDDLTSPIIRYEIRVKNTVTPALVKAVKVSDQNPETTLQGAHFDLYKVVEQGTENAEPIKGLTDVYGIKVGDDLVTNANGEITLTDTTLTSGSGLQFNQHYYLVETQAPAGYNGSDQPIELYYYKVTGTQKLELEVKSSDGSALKATWTAPTEQNPYWMVKVPNSTGTEMPHTGGMGTGLFTVGGGLLMVLAAGLYFWNKRRISEM